MILKYGRARKGLSKARKDFGESVQAGGTKTRQNKTEPKMAHSENSNWREYFLPCTE